VRWAHLPRQVLNIGPSHGWHAAVGPGARHWLETLCLLSPRVVSLYEGLPGGGVVSYKEACKPSVIWRQTQKAPPLDAGSKKVLRLAPGVKGFSVGAGSKRARRLTPGVKGSPQAGGNKASRPHQRVQIQPEPGL
jgi:hypothetical protein